ncbi:MAG: amidase [Deltaproteobacteria bacterium]|jgi:aspartyl-tRNA(Asn)/glutamyl-tRNA(Gln) amidotransferase subunit A|nr:amidase [Deltaproteobacteria bacterium]
MHPKFGYTAITKNLVYGVTRSPWNLEHTPGGSSGGSAAALAGGVCPLITSSDGGGSIRIPASFVGAFGLKPSFGRVPKGPFEAWSYDDTSVYGPTTRTVEDAALFMDQVVGVSPCDPNSLPHPNLSYLEALAEELPAGTRFGVSPDLGYAVVQSDVAACFEEVVHVFEEAGHSLVPISGGPPLMGHEWGMLGAFELAGKLGRYLPEREAEFGRAFIKGIKAGFHMTPEIWGKAAEQRQKLNAWCADLFDEVDFLLTLTVPYDPPPARGPFPDETEGREQPPAGVAAFTIPFNLSWHPAATMRAGLSAAGLPIGLQIVGPRHRDDLVLQASALFERARPWHPEWPIRW